MGHDFRPEIRHSTACRELFSRPSYRCLTASATQRVRTNIIEHLRPRDPYNTWPVFGAPPPPPPPPPNLPTSSAMRRRTANLIALRASSKSPTHHHRYAPTIARVAPHTVDFLEENGIAPLAITAYGKRGRREEPGKMVADELRVMVRHPWTSGWASIKAAVRACDSSLAPEVREHITRNLDAPAATRSL